MFVISRPGGINQLCSVVIVIVIIIYIIIIIVNIRL